MTQEISLLDALHIICGADDNGKADLGEDWSAVVTHLYNHALEEILPDLPLEEHDKFTRALFFLRCMAHRETGLDRAPST